MHEEPKKPFLVGIEENTKRLLKKWFPKKGVRSLGPKIYTVVKDEDKETFEKYNK